MTKVTAFSAIFVGTLAQAIGTQLGLFNAGPSNQNGRGIQK